MIVRWLWWINPKYWPLLLGIGFIRLFVLLPYTWQLTVGRWIGRLGMHLAPRRKRIAATNLRLCFPELSKPQHHVLLRKTFESMGMGGVETMMAWWMSDRRFNKIPIKMIGWDNYLAAEATGQGVIVACAHFTCLEMVGRHFGTLRHYALVYQKHNNPVYEAMMAGCRKRYNAQAVPRKDMRDMVRCLHAGKTLFYAPDQDFGADRSVFAPFFNIPTATVKATAWLTKAGKAKFVPVMYNRSADNKSYEIHVSPAFENFPVGHEVADAARFNHVIEAHARQFPDQYLWAHRRFKTRPPGEPSVYG